MRPYDKTNTRRRKLAAKARKALAAYTNMTMPTASPDHNATKAMRVSRLLWVQAFTSQALALETRGTMGDLDATPNRILAAAGLTLSDLYPAEEEA